jgi:hypothetical protein
VFFDGVFVVLSWLICGVFVVSGETHFSTSKICQLFEIFFLIVSHADQVLRDWQVASLPTYPLGSSALLTLPETEHRFQTKI